ncbi:MAG: aspartate--ammonia ligase [Erysipelotrichales bacterium]|nr:aspartate--ammonia ligase [Erysipelotrichales bacterium]
MENYTSKLSLVETQIAIKFVKDTFQQLLAKKLNLLRVSAPLFVLSTSGLNDGLSGTETPISFNVKEYDENIEIVHSLAKWKRMALAKYNFAHNSGLYTDMNAIRKDETVDFCHSIYVDQWDWEKVIQESDRNLSHLKKVVKSIYSCIYTLKNKVNAKYPILNLDLPKNIYFISTKQLEKKYPNLTRKERENTICREHRAVFLYQIGGNLKDKLPHDSRAADYDDWKLNGDILLYYDLYDMAFEISSMGIRVNKDSLVKQLKAKHEEYKLENDYCKSILNDAIPLSIGGGIGQSRLSMYMLKKAHIGEVQVSIWPKDEIKQLEKKNIHLL